ncbi:MAG: SpoIIIAH-like family protein [Firmicutes bacterium]|nr:SpoIIIAH-like family protein [Bacillota bacterium]
MSGFYVVHRRKMVYMLFLIGVFGLTVWYGFYQPTVLEDVTFDQTDQQAVVEALAGGIQRSVSELEQSIKVSVAPVPTKFAEYRIERERVRSRQLELFENIVSDASLSQERRQEAQNQLVELMSLMAMETEIENLLKANGYIDAVALVDSDSATVVVPVTLTKEEATRIGEIINRITKVRLERITIIDELSRS